jgi:hypothetical protein
MLGVRRETTIVMQDADLALAHLFTSVSFSVDAGETIAIVPFVATIEGCRRMALQ